MALNPGKRDAARVVPLLEQEWDDVEQLAMAVAKEMFKAYEEKPKFAVVTQLKRIDAEYISARDERAEKWHLGMFTTEKQATDMALGVAIEAGDQGGKSNARLEYASWVLPVAPEKTVASFTAAAKKRIEDEEHADDVVHLPQSERLSAHIRSLSPPSPPCEHLIDINDEGDLVYCALFRYHPSEHLPLEEAKKVPCSGTLPIPGERNRLAPCIHYEYHPSTCEAMVSEEER